MSAVRFARLLHAELVKLSHRPTAVYTALFVVVTAAVAPVILVLLAYFQPGRNTVAAQSSMTFPLSLYNVGFAITVLGRFISCILAADIVGAEYRLGTWKMIVPRAQRRWELVLAKALLVAVLIPVVFGVAAAIYSIEGFLGCQVLALPSTAPLSASAAIGYVAVESADALFFSMFAFAATVVFRSTIFGIAAGLLAPLLLGLFAYRATAVFLPTIHLANLQACAEGGRSSILDHLVGFRIPFEVSAGVLVAYTAVFVLVAMVSFARRDIAGV